MERWASLLVIAVLVAMRCAWSGEGEVPVSNVAGKKMIRASEELAQFWGTGGMAKADLPGKIEALQEAGESFKKWRELGYDSHPVIADPLFVDPAGGDYRLRADSPALTLGFKPIPQERIGPAGQRERESTK